MTRVVILTGSELRHSFLRMAIGLAPGLSIRRSYCEGEEKSVLRQTEAASGDNQVRLRHLAGRIEAEEDFFASFVRLAPDQSHPVFLPKGKINDPRRVTEIADLRPDALAAYGCSVIRDPLLSAYSGAFFNVHLGLSPYYRGTGTNFWPLVRGEPEYVGATFMFIDAGVDTGNIIHQIRARIFPGDSPHQIGNRLIADMAEVYSRLLANFEGIPLMSQPKKPADEHYYRRKDFSESAVGHLHENFAGGMIDEYLSHREDRDGNAPIIVNQSLMDAP